MQDVHNGQAGVQANEVRQHQRTHGDVRPILHDAVDVLAATDTSLKAGNSLVNVRHQDAVSEETRRVGRDRCDLAHALHKRYSGVDGLLGSLQARDNLHALLDRDRVHEVRRDHARGRLEVLSIRGGSGGDLGDGDGRGVGGEDRVLGSNLGKLGEDGALEVLDLRNRLDDKVH